MLKTLLMFAALGCLFVGCTTEEPVPEAPVAVEAQITKAMCGCSIEGIGVCGPYVEIDGEFVKLIHPSLGVMQFCDHKEKGVEIEIAGEMKAGQFVAASWLVR